MPPIDSKNFPEATFPVSYRSDFRVHFDPDVYAQINQHIEEDTSHEVGGILVGLWQKDENGPYATVTAIIRCDKAVGKEGEVTFTHETWNDIAREMDGPYVDQQIVGWYHSHPGFGVFLSERDRFIQEHFFSNPGQIALVVDPLSKTEGVFLWKNDKIDLGECFWVGQKITFSQGDDASTGQHPKVKLDSSAAHRAHGGPELYRDEAPLFGGSWLSLLVIITLCLGSFVLGGMLKPTDQFDSKERLLEGALYDYCIATGKRPGLEYFLLKIEQDLHQAKIEVQKLAQGETDADKKDAKEAIVPVAPERLAGLAGHLVGAEEKLRGTYALYCLSEKEKIDIIQRLVGNLEATIKTKPSSTKQASPETKANAKPAPPDKKPKEKPAPQKKPTEKASS